MTDFSAEQAVWTSVIKEAFGPTVELTDENGTVEVYDLVAEFEVSGNAYAVLRATEESSGEHHILKVVKGADGSLELVTIDDDDEWEDVTELYDEMTFTEE